MKKILVTTDFSDISKAGIRFAIQLAAQAHCELIFYNVNTKHFGIDKGNNPKNIQENNLKKFILPIYKTTQKQAGKMEFVIENFTDAAKAITRYAQENNIDFICINTSGPGIFNQLIGTTASKLITECPIPVIVVPYTYRMSPINLLLYASDLAKLGVELPFVKNFAALFTASTQVYHYSTLFDKANFKSHFNTIAENYKSENVSFNFKKFNKQYSLLNHLEPDIRRIKPSIIVMFTKKNRDWYQRHFHSSKTDKYGYDTNIPLLVFRK